MASRFCRSVTQKSSLQSHDRFPGISLAVGHMISNRVSKCTCSGEGLGLRLQSDNFEI